MRLLAPRTAGPESPTDPFAPSPVGAWDDAHIRVRWRRELPAGGRFRVHREGSRIFLEHTLVPDQLDNALAGLLATEVFGPDDGTTLTDPADLGRLVTGCVRSTVAGGLAAWSVFYANSLARLAATRLSEHAEGHDQLEVFSRIYWHASSLVRGRSVLDLGSCIGLLPIQLAAAGYDVMASDSDPAVIDFLTTMTQHRGDRVRVLHADAASLPVPDSSIDTVIGLHLLEHLAPEQGAAVVAEALRVARRRVVLAVPYEPAATAAYGHVRTFTAADLDALGASTGRPYDVHDLDGGWLVLDPLTSAQPDAITADISDATGVRCR